MNLKELYKLNTKGFEKLIKATSFLDKEPKENKNPIRIDGVTYKAIELNKLTVGENISIEQLLTEAQNTGKNIMADLIAILIREVKDGKVVDFNPDTLQARKELFLERLTVGFFFKVNESFYGWREQYRRNNKKVFKPTRYRADGTKEKEDPLIWVKYIDGLANGDITKHEQVLKINWIYANTVLASRLENKKDEQNTK